MLDPMIVGSPPGLEKTENFRVDVYKSQSIGSLTGGDKKPCC